MTYYQKYYEIINNRKLNPVNEDVKGHFHHIKPRSIYPELEEDKDSIVKLTYKEHLLAHIYLYLYYKEINADSSECGKMCSALALMLDTTRKDIQNKQFTFDELEMITCLYEEVQESRGKRIKELWKDNNFRRKILISFSNGQKKSFEEHPERAKNISLTLKTHYKNLENKEKLSRSIQKSYKDDPSRAKRQGKHLHEHYENDPLARQIQSEAQQKRRSNKEDIKKTIESAVPTMKPILQYDLDGNFIKEFRGAREAQRILKTVFSTGICNCANGKLKQSGGFIWRYKISDKIIDHIEVDLGKKYHTRRIIQMDLDGNEIKVWNSIKEASIQLKISKGTISNVLGGVKGKTTAGGFKWKYVD